MADIPHNIVRRALDDGQTLDILHSVMHNVVRRARNNNHKNAMQEHNDGQLVKMLYVLKGTRRMTVMTAQQNRKKVSTLTQMNAATGGQMQVNNRTHWHGAIIAPNY